MSCERPPSQLLDARAAEDVTLRTNQLLLPRSPASGLDALRTLLLILLRSLMTVENRTQLLITSQEYAVFTSRRQAPQ
jgi:hypothetical protein